MGPTEVGPQLFSHVRFKGRVSTFSHLHVRWQRTGGAEVTERWKELKEERRGEKGQGKVGRGELALSRAAEPLPGC